MRVLYVVAAAALLLTSCGLRGAATADSEPTEATDTILPPMDIPEILVEPNAATMTVEELVTSYLALYADHLRRGDSAAADATRDEMLTWLQGLSDSDKQRADIASEAWHRANRR